MARKVVPLTGESLVERWASSSWTRLDTDSWPLMLELMRSTGPLPEEVVRQDVTFLLDRMEFYGKAFPSKRALARRWGWGEKKVRGWLKRNDPLGLEDAPRTHQGRSEDAPGTHSGKFQRPESASPAAQRTHQGRSEDARRATRALGTDTDTDTDTDLIKAKQGATQEPDDWTQLRDHLATYRPTASAFRQTKGNGRELARMLKAVGSLEEAKRLITLAYTSKANPHPFNRERGKGHPPLDTLRRNGVRYLEDAQDEVATRSEGPQLTWDEVCSWWADGRPRGPVTRWFRDRGENPDNWTSRMHPRKRAQHRAAFLALGGQP